MNDDVKIKIKWLSLISLFFILWSTNIVLSGCGNPAKEALNNFSNALDKFGDENANYSEDIRKILAEVPSNEERIETIDQGTGPSFEEAQLTLEQIQDWLIDIIEDTLDDPQHMKDPLITNDREAPHCEPDETGSHGIKQGFICGQVESKSAGFAYTKDTFNNFFRADVTYHAYANYSEQSLLDETGLFLVKKSCNLVFCDRIISDLITTLQISSQKNDLNNFKGVRARLAFHVTETIINKDMAEGTSTYTGEALIDSGNQRYSCNIFGEDEIMAECRVE